MKVVAEARVKEVLVDDPETIWKLTNAYSGVSKEFFDQYYLGKDVAVAYELDDIEEYPASLDLKDFGVSTAPQSFIYLDDAVRCSLQHNPVSLH
jgi:predicted transcriptional regulator